MGAWRILPTASSPRSSASDRIAVFQGPAHHRSRTESGAVHSVETSERMYARTARKRTATVSAHSTKTSYPTVVV